VLLRKVIGETFRFLIEDEVDAALSVQRDVLGAMPRDRFEAE
jgi:hypothetical protein